VLDDKGMPWTVIEYLEEVKREIKRL